MNHYILASVFAVLGFALCFAVRALYHYIMRTFAKRRFRKHVPYIVGSNPRRGREVLQHTVDARVSRLSWSLYTANNKDAEEGIKEFAEMQGFDNTGHHVDTFQMARIRRLDKYKKLFNLVAPIRRIPAQMYKRAYSVSVRVRKEMNRIIKLVKIRSARVRDRVISVVMTVIRFIQNSGGVKDNDPNNHSKINQ